MKETLTIFRKELFSIFRDRATLIILFIPLLIFPIFNLGMNYLNKDSAKSINICVQYDSQEAYEFFMNYVENNEIFDIEMVDSNKPKQLLLEGIIDCYICITDNNFDFIYNSSSFDSLSLTTKLGDSFQRFYNNTISQSYDGFFQMNLKDEDNNLANTSNSMSSIFVPIVLVMLVFQNITSFANDIFAGEKERKTLELLLLSGVKKRSIYYGKALSLLCVSGISLILCLGSYFISFNSTQSGLQQFKFMQNENWVENIIGMILTMLFLSMTAVLLSLTISMVSKNMKNSQILNEIILAIPVGITAFLAIGVLKPNFALLNYIPILNLIINFYNSFIGNLNMLNLSISLITSMILMMIIIIVSIKYMNTEKLIN